MVNGETGAQSNKATQLLYRAIFQISRTDLPLYLKQGFFPQKTSTSTCARSKKGVDNVKQFRIRMKMESGEAQTVFGHYYRARSGASIAHR